jgi:hypothetical protein
VRYNSAAFAQPGDWTIFEVVKNGHCPCTEDLEAASDREMVAVYGKLRLLRAAGFPPDPEKGTFITQLVGRHECGSLGRVSVRALKVKPGPWRLYFALLQAQRREIDLLCAVAKKKWKRDPEDFSRCCRILDDIANGYTTRQIFPIPDR